MYIMKLPEMFDMATLPVSLFCEKNFFFNVRIIIPTRNCISLASLTHTWLIISANIQLPCMIEVKWPDGWRIGT